MIVCPHCQKQIPAVRYSPREMIILELLEQSKNVEINEYRGPEELTALGIARTLNIPRCTIYKTMDELYRSGFVTRLKTHVGKDPRTISWVYQLTPLGHKLAKELSQ